MLEKSNRRNMLPRDDFVRFVWLPPGCEGVNIERRKAIIFGTRYGARNKRRVCILQFD